MIAKIAYLSTPSPGRYMLNYQLFGSDELIQIEIGKDQMVNILVDGNSWALRDYQFSTRVPPTHTERGEHERAEHRS
jgi:hypothetical protein